MMEKPLCSLCKILVYSVVNPWMPVYRSEGFYHGEHGDGHKEHRESFGYS